MSARQAVLERRVMTLSDAEPVQSELGVAPLPLSGACTGCRHFLC